MNAQVKKLMDKLGVSEDEAMQIIADDMEVDKGHEMPYDLTKEQQKIAKKYTISSEHKVSAQKTPRKVRENPEKENFIALLARFLTENVIFGCKNVEITNKNREISFKIGENQYKLTLTATRNTKKE